MRPGCGCEVKRGAYLRGAGGPTALFELLENMVAIPPAEHTTRQRACGGYDERCGEMGKTASKTRLTDAEGNQNEANLEGVVSIFVCQRPRTSVGDTIA